MPIYDYACRGCGEIFELLVLKNTVLECPKCQGKELEQQLVREFAVSSESTRESSLQKARQRHLNSKDLKDKQVAEAEEIREHAQEHGEA